MKGFKIIALLIVAQYIFVTRLTAQQSNTTTISVEGQISLSTEGKNLYLNVGGPSIKFQVKKITFGISMFPTLKIDNENPQVRLIPTLGLGPQFYFLKNKRLLLNFPFCYNSAKNTWISTIGIGFVLTKPKS